jgi:hypothetical protein
LYSGKPVASIVVNELAAEWGLGQIDGRRCLNEPGKQAVDMTAQQLAELVDQFVGHPDRTKEVAESVAPQPSEAKVRTCSCGSGVPVNTVLIGGKTVALHALPLIFQRFREMGRAPDTAAEELFQTVKIYNYVPPEAEANYREAILREYAAFCASKE